jgi:hypothetical protein
MNVPGDSSGSYRIALSAPPKFANVSRNLLTRAADRSRDREGRFPQIRRGTSEIVYLTSSDEARFYTLFTPRDASTRSAPYHSLKGVPMKSLSLHHCLLLRCRRVFKPRLRRWVSAASLAGSGVAPGSMVESLGRVASGMARLDSVPLSTPSPTSR